jgi:hypothetical protein
VAMDQSITNKIWISQPENAAGGQNSYFAFDKRWREEPDRLNDSVHISGWLCIDVAPEARPLLQCGRGLADCCWIVTGLGSQTRGLGF